MSEQEQKQKQFSIPHNFWDNGRLFNLIDKITFVKLMICIVPLITLLVILPMRFDNKVFFGILLGGPIVFLFAFGWDIRIRDIVKFSQNRKVYYNFGKEKKDGKKAEPQMAYERAKKPLGYKRYK